VSYHRPIEAPLSSFGGGKVKRKRPVKKLQLSSETLLHLDHVRAQGVGGGTLTFEGTCENSLCPACTALCTGGELQ
jgi:hypothetical protein